jgi:hypothetical protein
MRTNFGTGYLSFYSFGTHYIFPALTSARTALAKNDYRELVESPVNSSRMGTINRRRLDSKSKHIGDRIMPLSHAPRRSYSACIKRALDQYRESSLTSQSDLPTKAHCIRHFPLGWHVTTYLFVSRIPGNCTFMHYKLSWPRLFDYERKCSANIRPTAQERLHMAFHARHD